MRQPGNSYPYPAQREERRTPVCYLCNRPVPLESCKTDENGEAMHEECYTLKLRLRNATTFSSKAS